MHTLRCFRILFHSERKIVAYFFSLTFLITCNIFPQTWQWLGIRYSVNNAVDLSVGYSSSTRVIYLAAKEDSLLRADGSTITWVNKPFVNPNYVACVSSNPDVVYAGGANNAGVWKSTNSGTSWTQVLASSNVVKMTVSPLNSNNLFAGGYGTSEIGQQSNYVTLYYSTNGGSTWNASNLPSLNLTVTQIVCDPSNSSRVYCSAFKSGGGVFISNDGGATWVPKIIGMSNIDLQALAVTPQNTAVLYAGTKLGASAKIYKTTNNGDFWSEVYSSTTAEIKDIKVDPFSSSTVYAVTSQGVLKSTNSGSSWSAINTGIMDLNAQTIFVDSQSPSNRVYLGTQVAFYNSTNGGSNWTDQSSGSEIMSVGAMAIYNDNVYYVTGSNTSILITKRSSAGTVWEPIAKQINLYGYFNGKDFEIDPQNSNYFYVAGKNSDSYGPKALKSTNNGINWSTIYQPVWEQYSDHAANSIFIDGSFICIGSHYIPPLITRQIVYSTNSGSSWNLSYLGGLNSNYFTIERDNSNNFLYAGGFGPDDQDPFVRSMQKSTDLGVTWNTISIVTGSDIGSITSIKIDPTGTHNVYALQYDQIGETSYIYKSTNGSTNWSEIFSLPYISNLAHHPYKSQTVFTYGRIPNGQWRFYQSNDGGMNWVVLSNSNIELTDLKFGYESFQNYPRYIYGSGIKGVYRYDLAPFAPTNVSVANYNNNPRVTWTTNPETDLASTPYKVYRKINYSDGNLFQDWTHIATVSGTSYIDNTIGVMPKPYQYVAYYKMTTTDLAGSQSDYSNTTQISVHDLFWKQGGTENQDLPKPEIFLLSQNHPNPFNPSTTINYQLPEDSHVMIKVFDMLGRSVATLVDDHKTTGYHNVQFDGTKLSSGMYIYKMVANKFTSTKKFNLMK